MQIYGSIEFGRLNLLSRQKPTAALTRKTVSEQQEVISITVH
jgi:hypothetical protein